MTPLHTDIEQTLRQEIEGEVRFDTYTRALYSTDASIYQIDPIGVVIPRHKQDVLAAVRSAARHGLPILARGGGTSLSGQSVGHAIHLDFSKYMNRVLEFNPEERWVRVEPGVIQDELNVYLRPLGFQLGPDTASSSRATLGGMIGNNSAGAHSVLYGKTIDHILELTVILSNGDQAVFKPVDSGALLQQIREDRLESHIYREIHALAIEHREEILARYPKLMRRVSGYNLDEFIKDQPFNLARIVVGSEGTLAIVVEAKVRVVPRPRFTALEVVHFRSLVEAVESSQAILSLQPAAMELLDRMVLQLGRQSLEYSRRMNFIQGDPGALMLVEFFGDSRQEVEAKTAALEGRLRQDRLGYTTTRALEPSEQLNIWKVRKGSQGLLLSVLGDKKPIAFVEDPAVPVENLPEFLRRFQKLLAEYDTVGGYYGHASVGCIHIRPLINLKQSSEVEKVIEFGGSLSGEHGDGLARSCHNERLFGPLIYQAFRRVKAAFDPRNLLNPGKVVDAPSLTENLRYGPGYHTAEIQTHYDFSAQGGFARAIEMCSGIGACRKTLDGTMCPSYMVTREEEHSTRGRANALRAALSGHLPLEEFTSKRMYEVLDLCLECKGCKGECPSNVDIAKIKYEFLAHYHRKHGVALRSRMFAHIEMLNRWGSRLAPLSNWILQNWLTRRVLRSMVGITAARSFPPFARPNFLKWFAQPRRQPRSNSQKVVLFNDCFMTYNYPQIGRAATELLEHFGFEVVLAPKVCCGRPMISKGLVEEARACASKNVEALSPYLDRGFPVLGCEPSCLLTFRDEYLDLLRGEGVQKLARRSLLIEEFLDGLPVPEVPRLKPISSGRQVLLHGHCHQKAQVGTKAATRCLQELGGFEVVEIDSGCCGMAGSFGFEAEHYELSINIGKRRLFRAVQDAPQDTEIVASGVSCRQQIEHGTGRKARHPVELLNEVLAVNGSAVVSNSARALAQFEQNQSADR
jgi:FAD/FMN-containing dehydrogenase/Fe-S oxidoreductase